MRVVTDTQGEGLGLTIQIGTFYGLDLIDFYNSLEDGLQFLAKTVIVRPGETKNFSLAHWASKF